MNTENGTTTMIQPPANLLTQVTNPNTNEPDYAFPLQTKAWLKMQNVVTQSLAFPLKPDTFTDQYGSFNDEGMVETALSILGQINTTAAKYGDPQTLIDSLSDFQNSDNPPSSIYGHAVWLAAQTQLAAQQIGSLLNQGLADIGQDTTPTQRLQDLTALLVGEGGVSSYASTLQGYLSGIAGTITFTGAGTNGDTVTINGVVITLVTSGPTGNQILIGGSASATAINLQAFLAASPALNKVANYTVSGAVVTIFSNSSITLAKSSTTITLSGPTLAGTITFTGAGSNGDTVTINGVVITLVTSGPTGNEILTGGSASATATNLQAFLAASADPALTVANYIVSGAVVTIVSNSSPIAGNSFTLATSSKVITLSGATLSNDTGFLGKVSDFYDELNPELTGQSNSLQWYVKQSGNVYTDAQNAVSSDQQQIEQLNGQITQLNKEYVGFTVAASVSPLFLWFPFFGILLAIADATTFGILASNVKKQLEGLQSSLNSATEDDQKKAALVTQLGGFNTMAGDVETDGQDFLNAISTLLSGWAEFSTQITTQLNALTPEDLENWGSFMDKVGFQAALTGWNTIASKAEAFFQAGFVKFSTDTSSWLSV